MQDCECHHTFEEHNVLVKDVTQIHYGNKTGYRIDTCIGEVTDGQSIIPCYCNGFKEITPEWEAEEAERSRREWLDSLPPPSIWDRLWAFVFRMAK